LLDSGTLNRDHYEMNHLEKIRLICNEKREMFLGPGTETQQKGHFKKGATYFREEVQL
jgi:hypothetical protein